ncbi:MAG TPA: DNA alkylation repair protein [Paracoccaceae bacterium]|nr:DNA alkylation repair protein [Paracoccaceae bacterium]
MTADQALAQLAAAGDPARAADLAAHHRVARRYLGTPNAALETITRDWRATLPPEDRLALAEALWHTDIHEGRIAAAKLLTQARIRPDDTAAWHLITTWVPQVDTFAIAEAVAIAGQKRLVADPARLDAVETWTEGPPGWMRRLALMMTQPWAHQPFPKPADLVTRDRVLGWCATLAQDRDGATQQTVAAWLRDLGKRDAPRAQRFLADHGHHLRPFALAEAQRPLAPPA